MNAPAWFYVSLNKGMNYVAIEARDEAHARRRATKGGNVVDGVRPMKSGLWLSVDQSFPLKLEVHS